MKSTKIAIVQESTIFLDLEAAIQKALTIIQEAASHAADIVVFGESWFGAYPPVKEVWADTFENAMEIDSKEVDILAEAAKKAGVFLIFGFNEAIRKGRGHGGLYNAILMIDSQGKIKNHHRKLMPTYTEKLVFT